MIGTLTRRSLRARWGRNVLIGLAITLGVSFVSGAFVLADSMRSTFETLFSELNRDVDVQVRATLVGVDESQAVRDPVPGELVDLIGDVPGVAVVEGDIAGYAQPLDSDGEPITTQGAPLLGVSWSGPGGFDGVELKAGRPPDGLGEIALDKATADRVEYEIGDTVTVVFADVQREFELVGLIGLGDSDGFGGASVSVFDPDTAALVLQMEGMFDAINVQFEPGADPDAVTAEIAALLPDRVETVPGQQVADEAADAINQFVDVFQTGLLIFAFVTAFVSAFIINNVFGITIGQRLRELALLRAIGAGAGQVRRVVILEAIVLSVVATIVGVFGGMLVARGIIAMFNAAGAGFPSTTLVMQPRTIAVAAVVGIGMTLLSVLIPAYRAAKIPPVAAMRPETGFGALSASRRMVGWSIATVVGVAMFAVGLFVRPGGSIGLIVLIGGGALLIFLGVASLSSLIARPASEIIGAPIRRLFGVPGRLAVDNAGRSPRRTARTASALMIGVAMISAASVFAASLRDTVSDLLDRAITADYIVTDDSFQGLPATVADELGELDVLAAVSPFRSIAGTVDGSGVDLVGIDPAAFPQLVELDVRQGSFSELGTGDAMLLADTADDLGVGVGDTVEIVYQNGVEGSLDVVGVFGDGSLDASWFISLDTIESVTDQAPRDMFVLARVAEGVDRATARPIIEGAIGAFPQADLSDDAEFRESQEAQINQLLAVITGLLAMAMLIAVIGIAITLALSVFERTREIGLLRAVGTTRRQLRRAIRWEAIIVSVFGAAIGVAVGLAFGGALAYAVPDSVISTITMPVSTIVAMIVVAALAGIVAAIYPARKASRMNVLDAITVE